MLSFTYQYLRKVIYLILFTMYGRFFVIMKFVDIILRKGVITSVQCTSLAHIYVHSCVIEYTLRTVCNSHYYVQRVMYTNCGIHVWVVLLILVYVMCTGKVFYTYRYYGVNRNVLRLCVNVCIYVYIKYILWRRLQLTNSWQYICLVIKVRCGRTDHIPRYTGKVYIVLH